MIALGSYILAFLAIAAGAALWIIVLLGLSEQPLQAVVGSFAAFACGFALFLVTAAFTHE